jgi:hypothetical protein
VYLDESLIAHTPQIGICPSAGPVGVVMAEEIELVFIVVIGVVEVFDNTVEVKVLVA